MPGRVVIFGWAESVHVRRWVAGLSERGWQIRLISLGGEPVTGVETINFPRRSPLSYFRYVSAAVRLAREFNPDLVHVHYAGGFGLWGLKCRFAPTLISVWGADVIDLPQNSFRRFFVGHVLRRATRITATSNFLREACTRLAPGSEAKTAVIPFGVTLPESIEPMPLPPVKLCFIKMHRRKYGPDILLKALVRVRQALPEVRLTLAGAGDLTPSLKAMVKSLGLEAAVDFPGLLPHEQVYSLLRKHHIMIMPSVADSESFGVAVLEAAACGRPTIASRVGGVPEVVKDGETGLLVPPGDPVALADAIIRLARDPELSQRMGRAGREFVAANYRWENSLSRMHDLYESMIHG